ncbi:hypothetical protein FXO38_14752 [Capsicum annuum]|nr:hypothetical protein FXO38_14752 [Capsicum annuum]KAF3657468.1 hypothetical protein FXO37_14914 [Capsicum annuum]
MGRGGDPSQVEIGTRRGAIPGSGGARMGRGGSGFVLNLGWAWDGEGAIPGSCGDWDGEGAVPGLCGAWDEEGWGAVLGSYSAWDEGEVGPGLRSWDGEKGAIPGSFGAWDRDGGDPDLIRSIEGEGRGDLGLVHSLGWARAEPGRERGQSRARIECGTGREGSVSVSCGAWDGEGNGSIPPICGGWDDRKGEVYHVLMRSLGRREGRGRSRARAKPGMGRGQSQTRVEPRIGKEGAVLGSCGASNEGRDGVVPGSCKAWDEKEGGDPGLMRSLRGERGDDPGFIQRLGWEGGGPGLVKLGIGRKEAVAWDREEGDGPGLVWSLGWGVSREVSSSSEAWDGERGRSWDLVKPRMRAGGRVGPSLMWSLYKGRIGPTLVWSLGREGRGCGIELVQSLRWREGEIPSSCKAWVGPETRRERQSWARMKPRMGRERTILSLCKAWDGERGGGPRLMQNLGQERGAGSVLGSCGAWDRGRGRSQARVAPGIGREVAILGSYGGKENRRSQASAEPGTGRERGNLGLVQSLGRGGRWKVLGSCGAWYGEGDRQSRAHTMPGMGRESGWSRARVGPGMGRKGGLGLVRSLGRGRRGKVESRTGDDNLKDDNK